jgi:hypothetical protein
MELTPLPTGPLNIWSNSSERANRLHRRRRKPVAQAIQAHREPAPHSREEKAELCLRIGVLCRKPPACVANGSIQTTREWIAAMKSAMATAKKVRASVPELTAAISSMERFK